MAEQLRIQPCELEAIHPLARAVAAARCKISRAGAVCAAGLGLILAFAAVYIFWGSTYLAIRFAIETMPPFMMAGVRFLIAGSLMAAYAYRQGVRPTRLHWRTAFVTGALLLLGGNGVLVWAEQYVASGLAALLVATVPLWVVAIGSVSARQRPTTRVTVGIALGLAGMLILVGPEGTGNGRAQFIGTLAIIGAAFSWALGTHYSRTAPQAGSPIMSSGMNMIAGGILLVIFATAQGEIALVHPAAISAKSLWALAYLVVFGSIIGFSAYMWLVKTVGPGKASSTFYVNPVVAVALGWLLAGEPLGAATIVAAVIIVSAVVLIVSRPAEKK